MSTAFFSPPCGGGRPAIGRSGGGCFLAARFARDPPPQPSPTRGEGEEKNDPQLTENHPRTGCRARPQAGRVSARARPDRPRTEPDRARHFFGDVERALLVQVLQSASAHAADQGSACDSGPCLLYTSDA